MLSPTSKTRKSGDGLLWAIWMVLDLSGYEDRELGQLGKTSVRTSSKFLVKIQNNDPVEKQTLQVKLLHPLQFQLLLEYYIVHAQLTSQTCSPFSTRVKIQAGAVSCPGLKKITVPRIPLKLLSHLCIPLRRYRLQDLWLQDDKPVPVQWEAGVKHHWLTKMICLFYSRRSIFDDHFKSFSGKKQLMIISIQVK